MSNFHHLRDQLREEDRHFGMGSRHRAADMMEDLIGVITRWQAGWDWADESVLVHASISLLRAKEETDRVLKKYGMDRGTASVGLKQYMIEPPVESEPGFGKSPLPQSNRRTVTVLPPEHTPSK